MLGRPEGPAIEENLPPHPLYARAGTGGTRTARGAGALSR